MPSIVSVADAPPARPQPLVAYRERLGSRLEDLSRLRSRAKRLAHVRLVVFLAGVLDLVEEGVVPEVRSRQIRPGNRGQ